MRCDGRSGQCRPGCGVRNPRLACIPANLGFEASLVRLIIIAAAIIRPAAIIIRSAAVVARRIAVTVVVVIALLLGGDRADGSNRHSHEGQYRSATSASVVAAPADRAEIRGIAGRRGGRYTL